MQCFIQTLLTTYRHISLLDSFLFSLRTWESCLLASSKWLSFEHKLKLKHLYRQSEYWRINYVKRSMDADLQRNAEDCLFNWLLDALANN